MRFAALALAILLLAGCAGNAGSHGKDVGSASSSASSSSAPDRLSRPGQADPAPKPKPASAVANATASNATTSAPIGGDQPPASFQSLTAFGWASRVASAGFATHIAFDFGATNKCKILSATSIADNARLGPNSITLEESKNGGGWGESSSGSFPGSAHAGPVDTRTVLTGGGGGATMQGSWGTFAGRVDVTVLAHDVAPGDTYFLDGNTSFALTVHCDSPFSVTEGQSGSTVLMADPNNLGGGAGFDAYGEAGSSVEDTVSQGFTSPVVRAMAAGFGTQAVRVHLDHPTGATDWTQTPANMVGVDAAFPAVTDGPGTYTYTVDQAGAYFTALWVAAWGLDAPLDLAAGWVSPDLLKDPFA